ncbi:hypothetical protein [Persephonella sp.]
MGEVFQVVAGIFVSLGGAGFIFWKLSSYLGNIWASKYFEKIKAVYQKELEEYKNELSILRENQQRFYSKQFELYSELWMSLSNLKLIGDILEIAPTKENLDGFLKEIVKTMLVIEKTSLFIEDEHYEKLQKLLNMLKEYRKYQLSNLSDEGKINKSDVKRIKKEYEKLIYEIRDNLRKQLKLK